MLTMKTFLLIAHVVGVALGVGGATMSDVLFLTSISDRRIDRSELKLLKIASKVVVGGLILLCISGLGFFFVGTVPTPRFWAKFTIVLIATLNGNIMHRYLFPIFEQCVRDRVHLLSAEFVQHAPIMVTAGAVSAISWYTALILGMWRTLTLGYFGIMGAYLSMVMVAVIGANIMVKLALPMLTKQVANA